LTGGRQRGLSLPGHDGRAPVTVYVHTGPRTPRLIQPSEAELVVHAAFLQRIKDPVWLAG
jgi:DNA polymerase-3 subunit epsilon